MSEAMDVRQQQTPPDGVLPDPYAASLPPRAPRRRRWPLLLALAVLVSGLGGAGIAGLLHGGAARALVERIELIDDDVVETGKRAPLPRGDLTPAEQHTTALFKQAAPAVVYITKLKERARARGLHLDATTIPAGSGSGFVWDEQGHIVTNYHVIRGGSGARVTLSDGSTWKAKLVGQAVDKDIAVLRIEAPASQLEPIALGTSEDLQVGQHVLAIGNPFGLDHTLSTGVISGLGREIKSVAGHPISGAIQTDAAINPGNSGGPLLDSAGRLIGVNTAIFSPSGASAGIGFAVPADTVRRIVPQLIAHGRVVKPGLGVEIAGVSMARRLGARGVLVLSVMSGSGAAKAGLRPTRRDTRTGEVVLGDVIVGVDGAAVGTPTDLYRALDRHDVGDELRLKVRRGQRHVELKVELVDLNAKRPT